MHMQLIVKTSVSQPVPGWIKYCVLKVERVSYFYSSIIYYLDFQNHSINKIFLATRAMMTYG